MFSARVFVLCVLVVSSLAAYRPKAQECVPESCAIKDNCRCSSAPSPIPATNLDNYPQLISITFTDSVSKKLSKLVDNLIGQRVNPDGNPALATFFVPHEFTDYQVVNDLYNLQYEIGVHSITRNNLQSYWRNASVSLLEQEFGGQRQIISKFANINIDEVIGARTPQYQLAGNYSIEAYANAGLLYDNTWPTLPHVPLFPYTLDYKSTQDCLLGAICPNEEFKGFWILPINDLTGSSRECNNLGACKVNGTAKEISDWLVNQIEQMRTTSRAPMSLSVDNDYFDGTPNSIEAFSIFLDEMEKKKDVFFVALSQVLNWIKNPQNLTDFKTAYDDNKPFANCRRYSCTYPDPNNSQLTITMQSCTKCPNSYPWLGNPAGN